VSPCMAAASAAPALRSSGPAGAPLKAAAATKGAVAGGAFKQCLNGAGLNLLKSFEGFHATVFRNAAGLATIGYGTVCSSKLFSCTKSVTEAKASAVLAGDITRRFAPCVVKNVRAPINGNQFSALLSFASNAGCQALHNVAVASGLNGGQPNYKAVARHMAKYNKGRNARGVRTVVAGLVRRRAAEGALFNNAAVTTPCAVRASRKSARALPRKALSKKKRARKLHSTIFGGLTRGHVDLPTGTMVFVPAARGTELPVKIKADIAADVRDHDPPRRKDRGPVGRLGRKTHKRSRRDD